jgi:hypothetical protein
LNSIIQNPTEGHENKSKYVRGPSIYVKYSRCVLGDIMPLA